MRRNTLTKNDLFRAAIREPLRDALPLGAVMFVLLLVLELLIYHGAPLSRLVLLSVSLAVGFTLLYVATLCCSVLPGLLLLRRQEKRLGFSFSEEGLTKIQPSNKWYLFSDHAKVLAFRRGFIRKVGTPSRNGKIVAWMMIEDLDGKHHTVRTPSMDEAEDLLRWLNREEEYFDPDGFQDFTNYCNRKQG